MRARVAIALTFLVLIGYGAETAVYYGRYLNSSLLFVSPARPFAIEDVLGFGFWLTWLFFVVMFSAAAIYWWRIRATKLSQLLWVVGLFLVMSAIDFTLYRSLEQQVLSLR